MDKQSKHRGRILGSFGHHDTLINSRFMSILRNEGTSLERPLSNTIITTYKPHFQFPFSIPPSLKQFRVHMWAHSVSLQYMYMNSCIDLTGVHSSSPVYTVAASAPRFNSPSHFSCTNQMGSSALAACLHLQPASLVISASPQYSALADLQLFIKAFFFRFLEKGAWVKKLNMVARGRQKALPCVFLGPDRFLYSSDSSDIERE